MRRVVVALVIGVVAGCQEKQAAAPEKTPADAPATAARSPAKTSPVVDPNDEPEPDKEPARFDPADARRTVRWIASVTQSSRELDPNHPLTKQQLTATSNALAQALQQTVTWKVPVEAMNSDGTLVLGPVFTTKFSDHSEKHPQINLRLRAWNSPRLDSAFVFRSEPWLSSVRPGHDTVTVRGVVTVLNYAGSWYNWFATLTDVHFLPDSDPGGSATLENKSPAQTEPKEFDPNDADKAFAWLRHQLYFTLDPFVTPTDRSNRKQKLDAQLHSLAGTKVRWRWPTTVTDDSTLAVMDGESVDYPRQLKVLVGLMLKRPKSTGKSGPARAASRSAYTKEYFGPGGMEIAPDLIAKVRESKKSTVTGKINSISAKSGPAYPPLAIELGVQLDDVVIEP
jgi:hypothetical protein